MQIIREETGYSLFHDCYFISETIWFHKINLLRGSLAMEMGGLVFRKGYLLKDD